MISSAGLETLNVKRGPAERETTRARSTTTPDSDAYRDELEAPSRLTIHTIPPIGDMPTSDEVINPGLLVLVQDLGHLDPSSEIDAGAFEPESVGESHRVRGSRLN